MVWILTQSHHFPFPIVTIGNKERLDEQTCRERIRTGGIRWSEVDY